MDGSQGSLGLRFSFWASVYDVSTRVIGYGTRFREATIQAMNLASVKNGGAIVDAGCGTGQLISHLINKVEKMTTIIGIDPEPAMLAVARARLCHHETKGEGGARVKIVEGHLQHMPLEPASIDLVVSSMVFHHLDRRQKMRGLREIYRVLRPGGRFLLVDFGTNTSTNNSIGRRQLMLASFLFFNALETIAGDFRSSVFDHFMGMLPVLFKKAGFTRITYVKPGFRRAIFLMCQKASSN